MLSLLSPSDIILLRLLLEGYSNSQISKKLFVTPQEVKEKLQILFKKLNIKNRIQAANVAALYLRGSVQKCCYNALGACLGQNLAGKAME